MGTRHVYPPSECLCPGQEPPGSAILPGVGFPRPVHPLRIARVSQGLTQVELAELAAVSAWTLSQVEAHWHRPSRKTRRCLADALGVPRDDALFPASR